MATEQEIGEYVEKILRDSVQPDFMRDLINWARDKYGRLNCGSKLVVAVHRRKLLMDFLRHVYYSGWHRADDGCYHIIKYLSHGEQAPMPVHIRMILDADKVRAKKYIKGIKFSHESE